jgi:thiosulfate dehydrogenase
MKPLMLVALTFGVLAARPAIAADGHDIAVKGTEDVPACASCHSAEGEKISAEPSARMDGLNADYFVRQLASYADGTRKNDTMTPIANLMSEAERMAAARYYAGLPAPKAEAAPADLSKIAIGATLARRGDWSRGVPGCGQCHGADGSGVGSLVPRLTGQSAKYIEAQLKAWQAGTRKDDPMGLMAGIAQKLDKTEIASVAAYYAAAPNVPAIPPDKVTAKAGATKTGTFVPPPDSAIPDNEFGRMVRLGENVFRDTQHYAAEYVGNTLNCQNCHLDGGRMADSSPLWAAFGEYPAYRSKNRHVNTYAERIQGCFRYSMNGKVPELGSETLVALEAYSFFLAKGAPVGVDMPGRGYPEVKKPAKPFDYARGEKAYARSCALCHGADGQGQKSADGEQVFPALWGANSYNWGAGMGNIKNAAAFIKANMPFSQASTLSDQDAWDVAAFVDSHERPQDPRFTGSVTETRKKFHDSATWMYGQEVNGAVLGEHSPPSGRR